MNQECLLRESVRAAKPGGIVLFSSYSSKFWAHRLEWFKMQSEAGLIGKIDYDKTKDGVIVCKDGFRATTVSEARFKELASKMNDIDVDIEEVDESCLFCKIRRRTAKGI
jgi:2-polyprenyl-6-hydroxyphenyl methylase/3-demethylubiquinone-9 3-methyltransferase